ncbi:molybdopterin-dependent oxidoreductase [Syntrophorhabdus aromaticivorans]|uniref:Molybdopterin-dependent oxidoreductase n=1 Tax=Syntrophorhabdus aromaticivorans TaxID=328301 RepID=A0A971M5S4_9BACT|nr:molybdopterin-dependent oxidoreductase [Syntrophorhabdus aromaticivorans]NLW36415.1 molybdopterin-dependent oxidoreductase [Syntrophorhabdus aromaticivorans]
MSKLKELGTPVFWAEGHPGRLDREGWEIEVAGLCGNPKTFHWHDLVSMPRTIADARLTSVTRFSVRGKWGGVRVADILKTVGMLRTAKYIRFWSTRKVYDTSISIDIAMRERTLLAYEFDGEYLDEDYGGPVRAFVPYLWGYKSAKSVVRIELMDHYAPGFWEQRGYSDDARIEAGNVRDMNQGGRIRPIPDGEVIHFLDE